MFCHHCGASDQTDKAYCKRCGKWLGAAPPEKQMIVMLVFNAISAVFAAVSAIALYATYVGSPTAKWSIYLAAAFCLVISVYQTISFSFVFRLMLRARKARTDTERLIEAKDHDYAPRLEAAKTDRLVDVPSVTENTTNLLDPVTRRPMRSNSK